VLEQALLDPGAPRRAGRADSPQRRGVVAGRRCGVEGPHQRERERVPDDGDDLGPDRADRGEEFAGVE
jgi:hypothetical protein